MRRYKLRKSEYMTGLKFSYGAIYYDEDIDGIVWNAPNNKEYIIQYTDRRKFKNDITGVNFYDIRGHFVHDCDCVAWVNKKEVTIDKLPIALRAAMIKAMCEYDDLSQPICRNCVNFNLNEEEYNETGTIMGTCYVDGDTVYGGGSCEDFI